MTTDHDHLACLNWRTLSDRRAAGLKPNQRIYRCALIVTGACNFQCPYCKTLGGDRAPTQRRDEALTLISDLIGQGLEELRLSGGEPTLVPWLPKLVALATGQGVRVAISSNGYAPEATYRALLDAGAAEFSISLDSLDPAEADRLAGDQENVLERVLATVALIAGRGVPVYIGMTCSPSRGTSLGQALERIAAMGVKDVKIMSLAQEGAIPDTSWMTKDLSARFPFLLWRARNFRQGRDVRGLASGDTGKCALVLDDVTIAGGKHYPCNVYFREGGAPIGEVCPSMLKDRAEWHRTHDSRRDPICSRMCMDLLRTYNNRVQELNPA